MARKKRSQEGSGSSDWLNTYADMVTLLLCFFILLFTMSTVDAEKWQALLRTFQNDGTSDQVIIVPGEDGDDLAGNEETPSEFAFLKEYIEEVIANSGFEADVDIYGTDSMVFLRLSNNLLFNPNVAVLRNETKQFLNSIGAAFKEVEDDISLIRINGQTASVDGGSAGSQISDRLLSSDRANAVLMYLEETTRFDPKKLLAIGYGKNYPIASNDNEASRAKNRRVEIIVMSKDLNKDTNNTLYQILSGDFDIEFYKDLESGNNNGE
ncbi:MAG: OmpA/MotB family protein [Erysipelotrichaceae bacterium]